MSGGRLAGRIAWVTGGGTGIGAAAAEALAAAGATVILSGRREAALTAVADRITAAGGTAGIHPLNVADPAAVEAAAASIRAEWGAVDLLVASAGMNVPRRRLSVLSTEDWQRVVDVNLGGVFHAVKAVLPGMRERRDGVIVVVSSWIGRRVERVAGVAYAATKQGLAGFCEALNMEEGENGIRCTCLYPGEVDTEVIDSRPNPPPRAVRDLMLKAADVGAVIRFVAEQPPHVCLNEITVSPTVNRLHLH